MATEIKILQDKLQTPIVFEKAIRFYEGSLLTVNVTPSQSPEQWKNILLLRKRYYESNSDLMVAYDDEGCFCLFLGQFNDGVV